MNHLSLRINLDTVVQDTDYEKKVLENIRRCSILNRNFFKVIFWNKNLTEKECQNFVKRNEKMLFEVNTKITSINSPFDNCWFLIDSNKSDKCKRRYTWNGDILEGIVKYIEVSKVFKKKVDEI